MLKLTEGKLNGVIKIKTISKSAKIFEMIKIVFCLVEKFERSVNFLRIFLGTVSKVRPGTNHRMIRNIQPPNMVGSSLGKKSIFT